MFFFFFFFFWSCMILFWPVIGYSASMWDFRSFSCIDAVHNRAMRFYLGVGRYTPNDAVAGEMGWKPTTARQWKSVYSSWAKISRIDNNRVNKRIALWVASKSNRSCKNWMFSVSDFLAANDLPEYTNNIISSICKFVEDRVFENFVIQWSGRINSEIGPSGRGRNKLRMYKLIKTRFAAENYCKLILPPRHSAAYL